MSRSHSVKNAFSNWRRLIRKLRRKNGDGKAVQSSNVSDVESIHAWDAWVALTRRRIAEDYSVPLKGRAGRLVGMLMIGALRIRSRWIDAALLGLTMGAFVTAGSIFWLSWPWGTKGPNSMGLVTSAAAATAFGSAILSAIALPMHAATELAAGYSAELLRRPVLWVSGLFLVTTSGGLFVLASMRPDSEAGLAACITSAGCFGLVWFNVRALIRSADPLDMARRQSRYWRHVATDNVKRTRRLSRLSVPRKVRAEVVALGHPVLDDFEHRTLMGVLAQIREGIRGSLQVGRSSQAITLWNAMVDTLSDYAQGASGRVGDFEGPAAMVFETGDVLVKRALREGPDELGVDCLGPLGRLAKLDIRSYEYGVVRTLILLKCSGWIEETWLNDKTRITVTALVVLGDCGRASIRIGAYEDADRMLRAVAEFGFRGAKDKRDHIGLEALSQFLLFLPVICASERSYRRHHLQAWTKGAENLALLRVARGVNAFNATEIIFPGISVRSRVSLQQTLWNAAVSLDAVEDLIKNLAPWLDRSLKILAQVDTEVDLPIQDGLSVICCLLLVVTSNGPSGEEKRSLCESLIVAAVDWLGYTPGEDHSVQLLNDDVAEMVWTALLTTGYACEDPELIRTVAGYLLTIVALGNCVERGIFSAYTRGFICGLAILHGASKEEAESWAEYLMNKRWRGGVGWDMHIPGFGLAPRMNRNSIVHQPELVDAIDAWALATFPVLGLGKVEDLGGSSDDVSEFMREISEHLGESERKE